MLLIPHILGKIKIKYIYSGSSTATIYVNLLSTATASHPYLKTLMVNNSHLQQPFLQLRIILKKRIKPTRARDKCNALAKAPFTLQM